jgi:hypothetical protein
MQTMPGLGTRPGLLFSMTWTIDMDLTLLIGFWEVGIDPESGSVIGLF